MPGALAQVIRDVDAELVVVSYNNESWVTIDELEAMCRGARRRGRARCAFDSRRYVGALIGIHNPDGEKVGTASRTSATSNTWCAPATRSWSSYAPRQAGGSEALDDLPRGDDLRAGVHNG